MLKKLLLSTGLALAALSTSAIACTGIVLKSVDGVTVPARTMEFGFDIESNLLVVPKGTKLRATLPPPFNDGMLYEAKYGFVGANGLGRNIILDGMNESGLYLGAFYFSGFAAYSEVSEKNKNNAIASEELGNWLLATCATVEEVKAALGKVTVVENYIKEIDNFAPIHWAITDAGGHSVVVEYTKDGLKVHNNKIGVVTNNPTYDWHMTNLRNYVSLTPYNVHGFTINGVDVKPLAEGSGMIGLPGDFTAPSRFVRAAAYVSTIRPMPKVEDAVFQAFHILNAFDIPKGAIRAADIEGISDYTIWTSVADTANQVYYFKTYLTPVKMKIDVKRAIKNVKAPTVIVMENNYEYKDMTPVKR